MVIVDAPLKFEMKFAPGLSDLARFAGHSGGWSLSCDEYKGERYLQVVESYRNEAGKPRHRVVANLGRIDSMEEGHLDALIRGLCRAAGRDEPAKVEIAHESARAYGNVFALHELWKDLGVDRALGRALRSGKRKLDIEGA